MAKRTDGCTYILLSIFITSHDVGSLLDQRNKISRYSKHLPINPDRDYSMIINAHLQHANYVVKYKIELITEQSKEKIN